MIRCVGLLVLLTLFMVAVPASAQLSANLGALEGDNAKGYLSPLPSGLSSTMNAAIFRTGDVPKNKPRFTVGVELMGAMFGDKDKTYIPVIPGYENTTRAPTVVGSTESVALPGPGELVLYHPGGLDIDEFVIAVPQITVGTVFGTQAVGRWISVDLGDSDLGKLELVGFGAQHSISQYFPGLPVALALGAFYQTLKIGDGLLDTKATHVDVTGSKKFSFLQPYAAVGFDSFEMSARYDYTVNESEETISVDFDRKTNAHLTIGVLVDLPVVKFHAELNSAATTGAAVGLALGF
jgi:hypothetical protein